MLALPGIAAPTAFLEGSPTPTPDRLAPPPTVPNPTQADEGAQLYWLNCQPCHGDRGQGLTDEWRAQYPPEDQNCWEAGCHGERPYENGFTLPQSVPALIGPNTLTRFTTAADLQTFISRAMPFNQPGALSPEEYWALTAFLLRAHGLPDSALPIESEAEAATFRLDPATSQVETFRWNVSPAIWVALGAGGALLVGVGVIITWRRTRRKP